MNHRIDVLLLVGTAAFVGACGDSSHAAALVDGGPSDETDAGMLPPGMQGDAAAPPDGGLSVHMGGPGCGLPSAAFCDTFDAPASVHARAGELDARWWSASRHSGTGADTAFPIGPATLLPVRSVNGTPKQLPPCRPELPPQALPDGDTLICNPSSDIHSAHLLSAVAAQNYGSNSYRIRQPLDFAGRTGKIVFDGEAFFGGLLGWISVELTDQPIASPGFSVGRYAKPPYGNDEGEPPPRNGFEVELSGGQGGDGVLGLFALFSNYAESDNQSNLVNVQPDWGKLNHFEVDVSQTKVDIYASPVSPDGVTFGAQQLIFSQDVQLPFTRGYVHLTVHNHATLKYTASGSGFGNGFTNLDAWIARFDNVGFDGPIIQGWREYDVGDALVASSNSTSELDTGWNVPDVATGQTTTLHFHGVDTTGTSDGKLSLLAWYCLNCSSSEDPSTFDLKYRVNGHGWHDRPYNSGELAFQTSGATIGALAEMLDVPVSELVSGDNTLDLVMANVPENYPPAVTDVTLILE
jgi:hypothetical protein